MEEALDRLGYSLKMGCKQRWGKTSRQGFKGTTGSVN